jgi:hypothetical protein
MEKNFRIAIFLVIAMILPSFGADGTGKPAKKLSRSWQCLRRRPGRDRKCSRQTASAERRDFLQHVLGNDAGIRTFALRQNQWWAFAGAPLCSVHHLEPARFPSQSIADFALERQVDSPQDAEYAGHSARLSLKRSQIRQIVVFLIRSSSKLSGI